MGKLTIIGLLIAMPLAASQALASDVTVLLPFLKDASFSGTPRIHLAGSDLQTVKNPKGIGTIIFVKGNKNLYGRKPIWIVLSKTAYALNGPAKDFAPDLKFSRDASESVWKPTGLNPYSVDPEVLKLTYGTSGDG